MFRQLLSSRLLSSASPRPSTRQVDFINNPDKWYIDAYMESVGVHRPFFKESHLTLWKQSFGDDYVFKLACLAGTNTVITTGHHVNVKPIDARRHDPFVYMGFGWVHEEFRIAGGGTSLLNKMVLAGIDLETVNLITQLNKQARRFWYILNNIPDNDVSYYNFDDFIIPNLPNNHITLKDVWNVPEMDIIHYDQRIYPYHREKYIISQLREPDGFGKVAYDNNGKVCGFGSVVVYPNGDCNVGPLYGDDETIVQIIFKEILLDMKLSGKILNRFQVRSGCDSPSFWISPFLKCKLTDKESFYLTYNHRHPTGIDFSKVFSPAHAELFIV